MDFRVLLVKLDIESGDTVFTKTYGQPGKFVWPNRRMLRGSDKSLLLIGNMSKSDFSDWQKICFMKIDSAYNMVFLKQYSVDTLNNNFAPSIVETPDKGYLIVGFRKYNNANPFILQARDLILLKVDSMGNQQSVKVYSGSGPNYMEAFIGADIAKKNADKYLICGFKEFNTPNDFWSSYSFATVNSEGELLDTVTYERHFDCYAAHIMPTKDGNFLTFGYERETGNDPQYAMLMKVSPDMKIKWKRLYRTSPPESKLHDQFNAAVEMPDGGYVLAGRAYGPLEDSTFQNGWVIRVDSLGCLTPGCDTIISTASPIPDEVAGISIFPNPTSDEITVQVEENIVLGYRLIDMTGRVAQDVQYLPQARVQGFPVSLREEAAGVYLIAVHTWKGWLVKKEVKVER